MVYKSTGRPPTSIATTVVQSNTPAGATCSLFCTASGCATHFTVAIMSASSSVRISFNYSKIGAAYPFTQYGLPAAHRLHILYFLFSHQRFSFIFCQLSKIVDGKVLCRFDTLLGCGLSCCSEEILKSLGILQFLGISVLDCEIN